MKVIILLTMSLQAFASVEFIPVSYYSTKTERVKILKASKKINEVISSQCFANEILNRSMIDTNNKSSEEVLKHLQSLNGIIPVKMYSRCMRLGFRCPAPTSAVAFRQPPQTIINLNRFAFYNTISDCDWASTMAHEGLGHSLGGYGHDFNWSKLRNFSVPYSINYAFEKCCK